MKKINRRFTTKVVSLVLFMLLLVGVSGYTGYIMGERKPVYADGAVVPTKDINDGFKVFWQAWKEIDQNFYGDTSQKNRMEGAISGMVGGLKDQFTFYMPPAENNIFRSDLQGTFGGIGAELTVKDGYIMVVSDLEGTPSEKAGLLPQDVILKIDGTKTTGMNFNDAINKIRGKKGTQVVLNVARQGVDKPFDLKITRDDIVVKSVKTSTVTKPATTTGTTTGTTNPTTGVATNENPNILDNVAYIKVNQFGEDTIAGFKDALTDAVNNKRRGAIIDLRNNPGGFLTGAIDAIGLVLPSEIKSDQKMLQNRVAVLEKQKDGEEIDHQATISPIAPDLPIVVLVNGGSASASEIFSGAMKDYGRAKLVGTQTFGKGSVQNLVNLQNGGSIKLTIAKWFTPLGNGIDGKGITPDYVVDLPAGVPMSTSDPQMQKALELIP